MGKKHIISFIFLLATSFVSRAQLSIGGFSGFMFPIGNNSASFFFENDNSTNNYRNFSKGFIPLSISLKYQFGNKFTLGLSYQNSINFNESSEVSIYKISYVSNLRSYNLTGNFLLKNLNHNKMQLFAGLNLGLYSSNLEINVATNQIFEMTAYSSNNRFGFGPQFGFKYILSDKISWESALKYNFILTSETLKSSLGYNDFNFANSQILGIETGVDFNF